MRWEARWNAPWLNIFWMRWEAWRREARYDAPGDLDLLYVLDLGTIFFNLQRFSLIYSLLHLRGFCCVKCYMWSWEENGEICHRFIGLWLLGNFGLVFLCYMIWTRTCNFFLSFNRYCGRYVVDNLNTQPQSHVVTTYEIILDKRENI